MKIRKIKTPYKEDFSKIPLKVKLKENLLRNYKLYYILSNAKIKIKTFSKRYHKVIIMIALNLAMLGFIIYRAPHILAPPSETQRLQYNLINMCTLIVFIIIYAGILRYKKLNIPRGGMA